MPTLQRSVPDLLDLITYWGPGMPVRPMEALLSRGPDATPAVLDALEQWEDEYDDESVLWLLVLLPRLAGSRAVEPLLGWLGRPDLSTSYATAVAEGLAVVAPPAVAALIDFLEGTRSEEERLWAYASLGWIGTDEAGARLLGALEDDSPLVDVSAGALAELGRPSDIPHLMDALTRCEPWQRADVEDAIRTIHFGWEGTDSTEEDWRLRYRIDPRWGGFRPAWPAVATILRRVGKLEERPAPPVRSLDEILAEHGDDEDHPPCEHCGRPLVRDTGLAVCPEDVVDLALLQHHLLGEAAEGGLRDLFDVLDEAEAWAMELSNRNEPRSRGARERQEDEAERVHLLRGTCHWLIGEGVESVPAGRTRLLAEAARLAEIHGDPHDLLDAGPRVGRAGEDEPGRNDPCPCGSERKYKKCCGRPGARRVADRRDRDEPGRRASATAGEAPSGRRRPQLLTRDGTPFEVSRAHYEIEKAAVVRERLAAEPGFNDHGDAAQLVWVDPPDGEMGTVLGTVDIGDGRLVFECFSRERLERGKAVIERVAGNLVRHRMDTLQDPWQAAADAPRGRRPPPSDIPAEVQEAVIRKVLEREYRDWPDEPIPALDGRTPRQAVRSAEGRRAVARLIRSYERSAQRGEDGRPIYDFGWMWRELGIERLRDEG